MKRTLPQVLVDVKIGRKRAKARKATVKDYNSFCESVCELYAMLDAMSIEQIERSFKRN